MHAQLSLGLDDPRAGNDLPKKERDLVGKIQRLVTLIPDVVLRVAEGVRREIPSLEKVTCDVVPFVARCRLNLLVDSDVVPWLTREIGALSADVGRALKPRRCRIEDINDLIR